jgi:hypothetical protein
MRAAGFWIGSLAALMSEEKNINSLDAWESATEKLSSMRG